MDIAPVYASTKHVLRHRINKLLNALTIAALISTTQSPLAAQVPDLTSGGSPSDTEYINLGPTGMEGWIYNGGSGKLNETADARQILVNKVDAGSPADGVLAGGDVILGADGTGVQPVVFSSDARKALAYAINDAEGNNPAILKLLRWRSGVTTTVSITLDYLGGSYTATAPYNCAKSAAILEKGIEFIMNNVTDTGYGGFAPTVLMAANDPSNPNNAARQARAQAEAYALNLSQADIDDMTSGDLSRAIGKPWSMGPQLITQAEYYLQTGDSAVLPSIQARAIQLANAQSLFGTMGHHYSLPGPNGEVNAPYGIGYGPVNNASMPCFIGLILAEKCGLTDQAILDGVVRAGKYYQYYADLGTVPYGENKETGSIANNGKSGLNAIALGLLSGYESQAKYFSKMSVFGASERDGGHTGPYFNHLWTPLGANLGGEAAMGSYFSETSWLYDLSRRWDGDFVYHSYYKSGGISEGYGQGHKAAWTTLLTYAAPIAQLHITGKSANPVQVLDAADLSHIDFASTYNPTTRTTAELIEDLKSPLPQLHWSAGNEIGANRTADHASILPTIIDMAQNGATYAEQHGAIYALNKIADDSTAAVLSGLCASPNSKVRYMAANALSSLSMAAKTAEVANIVNGLVANDRPMLPLDPENPMHVEKMSFATLLFDSNVGIWGGSRVTTADRSLLLPAFRIIAGAPMGVTVRDKAFSVASYLTKSDVEALADVLVEVASGPPPAEISYACRAGAIEAMQVNNFAEGVPAAVLAYYDMTKNHDLVLQQLENYAASSLTVQPDPGIIEFCKRLISTEDPYFFGNKYDQEAQAILDAIAADQLPEQLTPFKSIDWIFADNPSLSLPATSTVLRVQATDLALGNSFYTWRKVHGAGEVTFSPNGTAAAKDTTVLFDGTPGVYTFEVTMADDKGLTEAYGTVTVTLNNTGGSLPPNTAPTANAGAITAGQGTPAQLLLSASDPEGQDLIFTVTGGPSHGSLSGTAPHLIYTSDLAYTGADSITFKVMDTEGLSSSTATVSITVDPVASVGLAVYEPFSYPTGAFNGSSSVNEIGLDGSWTAQADMDIIGGSLNYGSLVTNGGALTASASSNSHAATRAINPAALAGNGLLDDGATLWFSAVLGHPGMISDMYLALANDQFSNSGGNHFIVNDGAQLGSGLGVWVDGADVYATHFGDTAQGGPVAGSWSGDFGKIKSGVQRLVVGKITWGTASDTIEIYLPWGDLVLPTTPSSALTVNVDQSTYDTLTISRNGTPLIDEIRFGSNYQSVVQGTIAMVPDTTAPTPDPMTFAVAPTPVNSSSITMTATPAFDLNEVEYYFTCTAGGAAGSGWQSSPTYTAIGLAPGVEYSFTVKARDVLPAGNETAASGVASTTIPVLGIVPDLVGILQSSAESLVVAADLIVGNITTASVYSLSVPAGHVLSQTPAAGSTAAYGVTVDFEISIGQDPAVPALAALDIVDDQNGGPVVINTPMTYTLTFSEDIDAATLDASDFANVGTAAVTIGTITETSPGVVTVGVTPTSTGILRFAVAAGATIQDAQGDAFNATTDTIDDTVITINLPAEVVPSVIGLDQAAAESAITAANLTVGAINSIYDELVPVGDVISQDPAGGSSIPGQSPVSIVVSLGPPPDTTGPVIVSTTPADGDFNVEVNAEIELFFDENVFIGTGNITLRNLNDGTDIIIPVTDSAQCLAYTNSLTITPAANMVAGKSYAVRISAGAVVDASGNGFLGINDNSTFNFSTSLTPLVTVLLDEDFEAPDVAAYSEGTTPANWVRATNGFGATQHGLTDKAGGDFSALDPNQQAYAFRYSNSGITTAEGALATVTGDVTYEVTFDVVRDDGKNAGTAYTVEFRAFGVGETRNDCTGSTQGTLLASTTGNANADGTFSTITFQHTVPAGDPNIGLDLALRIKGASTSANVDNVLVRTASPGATDQVPPVIASLTPIDDAENVSLNDNLIIIFDEDIAIGSGYITVKNLNSGERKFINAIDGSQVLLSGDTLQLNLVDDFDTLTFYSVQIELGVITDLSGNAFPGISDDTTWTFNTGETTDVTAPVISALSPLDGATGVSYRTSLVLTMDENVVANNTGTITLKNLTDATNTVIDVSDSSQVSVAGSNVTITPSSYLGEGKNYAVQMDAGAILDPSGNPFAGIADDTTWNFTISANNPPAIASLDPADESVSVDITTNLTVTFDEDIAAGTGNITIRNVNSASDTLIDINDATQVTITGPTLTINPTADLDAIQNFAILIDSGAVQDLAGNSFAGITNEATWNLATDVDLTGLVFSDDFEVSSGSPDVNAAGSAGTTSKQTGSNWVRATEGFGAGDHGIVDESSGQFADPGGEQAYAFRYGNSGITTAEGVIGTLAAGMLHRVSFSVVADGYNNGGAYDVRLVTFAPGAPRNDCRASSVDTSMVLETTAGNYIGTAYQVVSFEYMSDGASDAAVQGHDLAIRVIGAGTSATIDNVQISIVDAPPSLASSDIVDDQAGAPVIENTTVTYTLTFSEDMDATTVDVSDFGNAGTSNVTIDSVVETATPGVFTVAVTPTNPGTLQLQVNADSVLADTVGSVLDTESAIIDDTTITVEIDNVEPVADNQNVVTDEDVAVAVTLTASDVDPEDTLTLSVVTAPTNGTLSGTEPNLTYTPNGNFYGTDEFTFRAYDGREYSNVATVSISVNAVNDAAPVANPASVATNEDTGVAILLTASDVDLEDTLTYSVVTAPTSGTLSGTAPNLTYTPNTDFNGSDEFTFKANDGSLDSNTAKVNISVFAVNDAAPVANDGSATVEEDKSVAITLTASDVDPEDVLTYSVVTVPANGTLSGTAPNLTYTPDAAYLGADAFTFKANDGTADSNIATVSITVNASISGGVVFADNFEAGVNPFGGTTADVASYNLNNTSKSTNTALWVRSTNGFGSDRNGLIDEVENGGLNFTDPVGEQAYGFRYTNSGVTTVEDLLGALTIGSTIDVSFDVVLDGHNGGTIYDASLLLFETGAARNNVLSHADNSAAVLARATGNAAGDGSYTTVTFSYVVGDPVLDNDGAGAGADTTWLATLLGKDIALRFDGTTTCANIDNVEVSVTSTGGGGDTTPPTLASADMVDDALGGPISDTSVTYTITFSEDMDDTTVDVTDFGNAGTASVVVDSVAETTAGVFSVVVTPTSSGSLQLQLNAGSMLKDISGNALDTATAITDNTTITVDEAVNSVPVADNQSVTTDTDVAIAVTLTGSDNDLGDLLAYSVVTGPTNGTLSGTEPNLTYTPNSNFNGTDEFTFKINDGSADSNIATVSITVNVPVNTAPVASDDSVVTEQDVAVAVTLAASDANGDELTWNIGAATYGVLSGTAPNLTYTPNAGFAGSDSFIFKVNDGAADSNVATVSITVNVPVNNAPVASNDSVVTEEDVPAAITLVANDVDGDQLSWNVGAPASGVLSGTAPNLTYTPNAGFSGSDSFTFMVNDGEFDSNVATVSITVNEAPNNAPVASNDSVVTKENAALAITLVANDPDDDVLTWNVSTPTNGVLSGTAPNLIYTPNADFIGSDSITFSVDDGEATSNVATVSITVNTYNYGQLIFEESFESPVVAGYVENTVPDNGMWVGSTEGFGATFRGLSNETVAWPAVAPFTTPYGDQGYKLDSGGAGLTTAQNVLGETVAQGVRYTVKFNVATESGAGDATYEVQLVTFEATDTNTDRADLAGAGVGTVLATASGTVSTTDMSHGDELSFTAPSGDPSVGKELGIRLMGGTGSGTYDQIVFFKGHDMHPTPEIGSNQPGGNVPLSWTNYSANAGTDVWVDVWFGTNPLALTKVVDAGLNATTTTVNVSSAGTYYWRVDSYANGSTGVSPLSGDLFHFTVTDGDADGLPDDYELAHTDPASATALDPAADLEGDGLTNADEYYYGTDPNGSDTDGDTLIDGAELSGVGLRPATSPVSADTDNDGLSDDVETNTGSWGSASDTGTNPVDVDWDKDGLVDGAETNTGTLIDRFNTGTNPLVADTDADGAGDYYEVVAANTNPFSAANKPSVPYPLPDPDGSTGVTNKPVKVYIMAGQSNMVGIGYANGVDAPGSLEAITKVDHKFPNLIDGANNWTQRQDVIYKGVVSATAAGPLTAGQGSGGDRVGPELGFGHVMGYYHDEPVLLLKASQGNRSLAWDFCPPTVTNSWDFPDGNTYAAYGDSPDKWTTGSTPVPSWGWYAGKQYDECFRNEAAMGTKATWVNANTYNSGWQVKHNGVMYQCNATHTADATNEPGVGAGWASIWSVYEIENAYDVLANFATLYPDWAAQGYEIAGFVWWQGHKDGGEQGTDTAGAYASKYEDNLVELINSLRAEFSAPSAPFVVATVGFGGGGWNPGSSGDAIYNAQLAVGDPAQYPAFDGNVKSVDTTGYWRSVSESPGVQGFHYNNNAETYTLVGDAMGRAMIDLMSSSNPDTTPPTLAGSDIVDDAAGGPVPVNNPVSYTVTFNEDMDAATVDVTDFGNAGTSSLTVDSVTETGVGVFTVAVTPTSSGSLQLQVNAGAVLNDVAGNSLDTASAILDGTTITVAASNNAPVANDDSLTTDEDVAVAITLTATDADVGDTLTYAVVTGPTNGVLSGTVPNLTYTPNGNYNGADSFTFKANDGTVDSNIATVSLTVNAVNDAPVAAADSATTNEDVGVAITLSASDIDSGSLTYAVVTGPTNGVLSGTAPNLTYTPSGDYNGADSFTFKANDGTVDSNIATVSLTVNAINDAPLASADAATTNEDTGVAITLSASDIDSGSLTYAVVTGPTNGVLSGTAPNLTYTPNGDYNGADSFTFKANDGLLDSNTAAISITVNAVNDAPVAAADSATTDEDAAVAITLAATDVDAGDTLTYAVVTGPTNGVLSGTTPNLTYTPNGDYNGADSFTFKANDGTVDSNLETISITVNAVNDAPVASADSAPTDEDVAVAITLAATDVDTGDTLIYAVLTGPTNGVLSGTAPNLTYTPNGDYNGADSFTFKANDGTVDSNIETISITVNAVNDAPVASDDSATTNEDTGVAITLSASDIDVGDSLTYAVVSGPTNGTLSGTVPNLTYTPNASYTGADSFTFTANDGMVDSNLATISLSVTAVNDAPVASSDVVSTDEDTTLAVTLVAADAELDPLTYVVVSAPSNGILTGTAPNLSYSPNSDFNGADSFTFKANDGTVDSNTATVSVTVNSVNDEPVANDDSASTEADVAVAITLTATDVDIADVLTYVVVTAPSNGSLSGTAPNLTYTPNAAYTGADSFTFTANDGSVDSNLATISLTVNEALVGGLVFADDFEPGANTYGGTTADVSSYTVGNTSKQANPTLWVRSTNGFGADRNGLIDETENTGLNFTDLTGTQAYGFRYTNSGVTSAHQTIGSLAAGTTVTVSFDVVTDGFNGNSDYNAALVLFDGAGSRFSTNGDISLDTAAVLKEVVGTAGASYSNVSFSYVVGDDVVDNDGQGPGLSATYLSALEGKDIAIRFSRGSSGSHAIIDNVEVSIFGAGGPGNTAPTWALDPVNETDATEDAAYASTLADDASDTDSDPLTFAKVSGAAWLSVASDGTLSGTPTNADVGANAFTVSVSDGTAAPVEAMLNITVININDAPVFTADPINGSDATEGLSYSGTLAANASDEDAGADLTYAKVSGPAWLNIATDGTLSGTPSNADVGMNIFTVSVSDGIAAAVEASLNITVINTNDAPVWLSNPVVGSDATEDSAYGSTLASDAIDIDGGASLTFAKVSGPAWLSVAANGSISGTPSNADVGANVFTVSVTDSNSTPVEATLNITVLNTNDAPVFTADPIAGSDATEDGAYAGTINGSAIDEDSGDSLTYAKVSGPAWLSVATNGELSGTPVNSDVGANAFTVSVTDGVIAIPVEATLNITVLNTNDAPVFTVDPITVSDATEDGAYASSISGTASDEDVGDSLIYSKVSGPLWLIVASNGDLSGTALNANVGANSFTVSVSDGNGGSDTATINITVLNVNDAPVFTADPIIGTDATEGQVYSGSISATDEDAVASLNYSKVSGPAWLSIDANGLLSGTPGITDVGANSFTVSVSDGIATPVTATLEIEVIGSSVSDYAYAEVLVSGSVNGAIEDTFTSDDAYELITERQSGGKPSSRYSYLEHKWEFDVAGGDIVSFQLEAYHTANSEGDNFTFAYSTTGENGVYTDMLTVTKTVDDDTLQSFILPAGTSGIVHVRVLDTDSSSGNQNLDSVSIDEMFILSEPNGQ